MSKKIFLVDVNRCNGCHNCQIACKDEHCGTSWLPYAAEQPDTGQFWCKVEQEVHGSVPKVNITYLPKFGAQTEAIREYAPEVLADRDDGLIVIDPEKARGRKDIAERFEGVYWNAELGIPQGCTGCAHLLDDGWTVPRCVDVCAVGGLRFGDESDFADELVDAEKLEPKSNVYYLNLPKRWIAGQVVDEAADEVVCGVVVTMQEEGDESAEVFKTATDEFGDFWFRQVEGKKYHLWFEGGDQGFVARELAGVDASAADQNVGRVNMYKMIPLG